MKKKTTLYLKLIIIANAILLTNFFCVNKTFVKGNC